MCYAEGSSGSDSGEEKVILTRTMTMTAESGVGGEGGEV